MLNLSIEEEKKFIMAKEIFLDYLNNNNIFYHEKNDYQLKIKNTTEALVFFFINKVNKDQFSIGINTTNKDKNKICFLYSSFGEETNHIVIKKDIKNYKIALAVGNLLLEELSYENLHKKYNKLDTGINSSLVIKYIFDEVAPYVSKEDFELFSKHIKLSNIDDYFSLINNNIENITNLVIAANEATRNDFDLFNLSEQQKDIIQLNSDIIFNFNKVDKKSKVKQIIDILLESTLPEEEREHNKKNKSLFQNLKSVLKK